MGLVTEKVQLHLKKSSTGAFLFLVRMISGMILGLTFALVGEEIFGYGTFAFLFVIVVLTSLVLRFSRNWGFVGILVFDLVCVLIGMLLRLYIVMAPGT